MTNTKKLSFRTAAAVLCAAVVSTVALSSAAQARGHRHWHRHFHRFHHAAHHHTHRLSHWTRHHWPRHIVARGGGNDFQCAVQTAYGEANGKGKVEAATVVYGLVDSARKAGISVCSMAHRRYAPRAGSAPDIIEAVNNVFNEDASLVPVWVRPCASEFRSPGYHSRYGRRFHTIQLTPGGNVFRCIGG